MTVKVETYQKCEVTTIQHEDDSRRQDLARGLGLVGQVTMKSRHRAELATDIWPALTAYEYFIWCQFLPGVYSTHPEADGSRERLWGSYTYDVIPEDALEQIRVAKESGLFDWFEIRTPEKFRVDPIVLGALEYAGTVQRHLVVRWGEALLPFDEIRRKVQLELCHQREAVVRFLERNKIEFRSYIGFRKCLLRSCCGSRMGVLVIDMDGYQHIRGCLSCFRMVQKRCNCPGIGI